MNRTEKETYRVDTAGKLNGSSAVILAEYRGLSMDELTALRVELRKHQASFKVCKNRIVIKALDQEAENLADLKVSLKGPLGILFSEGDAAQATKIALEFEKNHPKFVVKAGFIDQASLNPSQLKAISELPSKEVLLAKIVGSLIAPHRGLLGVLNGVPRQLVQVINAIKEKKST